MSEKDCNKCSEDSMQAVQTALCVVGDKWSALIIQLLHSKPQRFTDLKNQVEGINPRTLSQRLTKLQFAGVIEKKLSPESSQHVYELTPKGKALNAIIHDMAEWGKKYRAKLPRKILV